MKTQTTSSTSPSRPAQRAILAAIVAGALGLSACSSGAKSTDAPVVETTVAPAVETSVAAESSAAASVAETAAASVAADTAAGINAAASADTAAPAKPTDTKVGDTKAAKAADTKAAKAGDTKAAKAGDTKAAAAAAASNANVDANAIPKLKGEVGALADVTVKDCAKDGADWTAKGSLTNSSKSAAAYVITTSFLDDKGTTLGLGWSKIDSVKAGGSQDWSVKAPATGDKLQCIMRVTRGAA